MSALTPNEQSAAQIGQESPNKDAADLYDKAHGRYATQHTQGAKQPSGQPNSTVNPLSGAR